MILDPSRPAGSDTYVQYNDGGLFGGDSTFTFNDSTKTVAMQQCSLSAATWQIVDRLNLDDTNFNLFLGTDVFANDAGQYNVGIGYQAGYYNDTTGVSFEGDDNVYIGAQAGLGNPGGNTGYRNVAIGRNVLYSLTIGSQNVGLGVFALSSCTEGVRNMAIGESALTALTTGDDNVAIGRSALVSQTTGGWSVALGTNALYRSTTGQYNSGIGVNSLYDCTGSYNVGIGGQAGLGITGANFNVFIGYDAGQFCQGNAQNNTVIGAYAGRGVATNKYDYCTMLGYQAGYGLTTGDLNVFLGYQAGYRQTTNSNILIIDNQDRTSAANEAVRSLLYGTFAATPEAQSLAVNGAMTIANVEDGHYVEIKSDGEINLHGTARVWKSFDVEPEVVKLPSVNPPAADEIDGFSFLRFDRGTEESAYYKWEVPEDFATGTGSVRGRYEFVVFNPPTSGGTNVAENVRMGFEYKKISKGAVFDFTAGTSSGYIDETIAVDETAEIIHQTAYGTCDTTGWAVGDTILFRFYRDATAVEDTYDNEASAADNDVWLFDCHMNYLVDKLGAAT